MALPWIIGAAAVAFGVKKIVDIRKEKNSTQNILAASKAQYEESMAQLASGKRELENAICALGVQAQNMVREMGDFQNLAKNVKDKILENSSNKDSDESLFTLSIPQDKLQAIAQFLEQKANISVPKLDIAILEPIIATNQWILDEKSEQSSEAFALIQKDLLTTFEKIQISVQHQRKARQYVEKIQQALSLIQHVFHGYAKDLESVAEFLNPQPNIDNEEANNVAPTALSIDVAGVAQMIKNGYALSAMLVTVVNTAIFQAQADAPENLERDEQGLYKINAEAIEAAIAQSVKDLPNYLK